MIVVAAVAGALCAQGAAARNLVTNFDHREKMGVDLPTGWVKHIRHKLVTTLEALPQPDGSVRFVASGEPWAFYEQRDLTLVPGAKYHLSYEVKTAGLGGAPAHIFLHDSKWSWKDPQKGPKFPDDTKGKWLRQEAVVTMCDNPGATNHTLSISCIHGQAVSKVDFSLRDLRLEAVDADTDRASRPIGAGERLAARIVPVDPLLSNVNADDARLTFYWPGVATGGISSCRLVTRFRGKQYNKPVMARFDDKGYATVRYGRVWPSKYEIEAEVVDAATNRLAKNEYTITVKRREKPLTVGKRLNNFVTALVDQPLENGEVAFSRATPGWVWISFEGDVGTGAVGYLDEIAYPVVRYRDGENRIEAQRFVAEGAHKLRISGAKAGGRLRIHAVKTIWGKLPTLTTQPSRCYRIGFRYTLPFCNRFDICTYLNTCAFGLDARQHVDPLFAGFVYERGMKAFVNVKINPTGPVYDDYAETWKKLTEGPWTCGFSLSVDENTVNQLPRRTIHYSEAVWNMLAIHPEQSVNLFYADTSRGNCFDRPQTHVSEIAATVNSGNGTGLLCPELYAAVQERPEDLDKYLAAYAKFVTSALEMVPASRGKVVLYGATYVQIGDWSNYVAPATDIKAHYAKMYRAFATDPRFDGCAGLGCGGLICGGEELLRWVAKCVRYYGIEGGTGDLAEECGFAWAPGIVKNADMDEGLTNWTVKGEVAAERFRGYGERIQKRHGARIGQGDGVATFTTKADSPNELSQELSGLQPGKLYAVICCVADRDDIVAKAKNEKTRGLKSPLAFSVRLEGATEYPNLRYETVSAVRAKVGMRLLRYVFRADSDKARLVFTDRKDDGSAAPDGFKQALNYISFMPYYVASPDDPEAIAASLGWKDANRVRNGQ